MISQNIPNYKYGDLLQGLDGIEKYLGLKAGQAVFLNEYCISSESFPDLSEPGDWVLDDTWSSMYPLPLAGKTSSLLALFVPPSLSDYLVRLELISKNANIIETQLDGNIRDRYYPNGSVIGQLQETVSDQINNKLRGKTFIPSFVTRDIEQYALSSNGKTLIPRSASIDFNSKSFLRRKSMEEGFPMAPGIIIEPSEGITSALERLNDVSSINNFPEGLPVWLKFSTAAGGGTLLLDKISSDAIETWVYDFIKNASNGYKTQIIEDDVKTFQNIPPSLHRDLVLEFDINSLPDTKILENFGFQAIVGDQDITYLGATKQMTKDGEYIGGETLSYNEDQYLREQILPEILPVFKSYWQEGYRGIMGIDAVVAKQKRGCKVYILEANCRMTAATPLLGITQKLKALTNTENLCGRLSTFEIPIQNQQGNEAMKDIFTVLDKNLYGTKYQTGILPFMADVFPHRQNIRTAKVRCVLVGEDSKEVSVLEKNISQTLKL